MSTHFKTVSFYLAVFLISKGGRLVRIDRSNPQKCVFVFDDVDRETSKTEDFNFSAEGAEEVLVDARSFVNAIKSLKEKLYQE